LQKGPKKLKKVIIFLKKLLYCSMVELYSSIIEHMKKSKDELDVLRKIAKDREYSQRTMAKDLGFSLGKLNYCLNALKKKGLVKIVNFKNNPKKTNYLYIITPRGIKEKANLTVKFMERIMKEYDELKKDLKR